MWQLRLRRSGRTVVVDTSVIVSSEVELDCETHEKVRSQGVSKILSYVHMNVLYIWEARWRGSTSVTMVNNKDCELYVVSSRENKIDKRNNGKNSGARIIEKWRIPGRLWCPAVTSALQGFTGKPSSHTDALEDLRSNVFIVPSPILHRVEKWP